MWPEYTVGRAWLIVRDVNIVCHMQIGVSFIWVEAEWILACSESGRTVWGERWRGKVRDREEDRFQLTNSKRHGMCAEVPFCDWSACVDVQVCRRCEEESSVRATLISGVILSSPPQGHAAKRALSESTAGQHTAESMPYSCHTITTAPHGLSDGFTRVQTRLVLSPRSSYRPSLIPLLLDNINANRRLFSHPST